MLQGYGMELGKTVQNIHIHLSYKCTRMVPTTIVQRLAGNPEDVIYKQRKSSKFAEYSTNKFKLARGRSMILAQLVIKQKIRSR